MAGTGLLLLLHFSRRFDDDRCYRPQYLIREEVVTVGEREEMV